MKSTILITIIVLFFWCISLFFNPIYPLSNAMVLRKELINLTGVLSVSYMAMIMVYACRFLWVDKLLGGLDKVYRQHKWLGIAATLTAIAHYLIKNGKGFFLYFNDPLAAKIHYSNKIATFSFLRSPAKDVGEWMFWILLVAVVLTLWTKIPYRWWRYTHKFLSILFLLVAFHSVVLMPSHYWSSAIGFFTLFVLLVGSICAVLALTKFVRKKYQYPAIVHRWRALESGIIEIVCQLSKPFSLLPGQFAFLKVAPSAPWHPFTVSCFDESQQQLRFSIKQLGHYTKQLDSILNTHQEVLIEGPYGRFKPNSKKPNQLWIATGIGITPFLAWLHYFKQHPHEAPEAKLIYCIKNEQSAFYAQELNQLVSALPSLSLRFHYSEQQGRLIDFSQLGMTPEQVAQCHIWFCGSVKMAENLTKRFKQCGGKARDFHREYFEFR